MFNTHHLSGCFTVAEGTDFGQVNGTNMDPPTNARSLNTTSFLCVPRYWRPVAPVMDFFESMNDHIVHMTDNGPFICKQGTLKGCLVGGFPFKH